MAAFRAELQKAHRRHDLALCLLIPGIVVLWVGNPLPALCVGIVGALVGLFSAFMPPLASYFVPFGYYIPLSAYEVANWDKATHTVTYGTRPFNWGLLAFTLALGAVLFALAWRKVQDEEV